MRKSQAGLPAFVEVAARLRRQILAGRPGPNGMLPSEAELGERFGVSRSTVREGLRLLSAEGLLVTRRGLNGGSRVAEVAPKHLGRLLGDGITMLAQGEGLTVRELLDAREYMEVPAARLAAKHRTDEHITEMRATIDAIQPERVTASVFEANRSFHGVLLDASGNRMLNLMAEPVFTVLQTRFLRDRAGPAFWRRVVADHTRILDAIVANRSGDAAKFMLMHLERLRPTYERIDTQFPAAKRSA